MPILYSTTAQPQYAQSGVKARPPYLLHEAREPHLPEDINALAPNINMPAQVDYRADGGDTRCHMPRHGRQAYQEQLLPRPSRDIA